MSGINNFLGMVTIDQGAWCHLSIELKSLIIKIKQSLKTSRNISEAKHSGQTLSIKSFVTQWKEAQLWFVKLVNTFDLKKKKKFV